MFSIYEINYIITFVVLCGSWSISWNLHRSYCLSLFETLVLSACCSHNQTQLHNSSKSIHYRHSLKLQKAALFLQSEDVSDSFLSKVFWCYAESVACKQCVSRRKSFILLKLSTRAFFPQHPSKTEKEKRLRCISAHISTTILSNKKWQ